ncbi:MAG TPA: patatin-like phospholipase family protein [Chitinophagaceae bacterium]|nr:patatin-like phospholipase family protein [Chitinophagaceae bacterium]
MKQRVRAIFYSFPLQLLLLHFKKFQVLLVFWLVLFAAVGGAFMKAYGVDSLYLAPEYLGNVNAVSAGIVGLSAGVFIMSWNITSFILFCRHFKFLATTTRPFLKYCINNSLIPIIFLLFYLGNAVYFNRYRELNSNWQIFVMISGFTIGFILIIAISFLYFFRADKSITQRMATIISHPNEFKTTFRPQVALTSGGSRLIKVTSYLNSPFTVRPVRDVAHYSALFIDTVFSRHNFAAMLSVFIAFIFLITVGFFLDHHIFQLPAAASITLFFAILVAVAGAFSYFLQSWSVPFFVLLIVLLNFLYKHEVIDPTNKAYGLNYSKHIQRADYSREGLQALCTPALVQRDKKLMIQVLENWKKKQKEKKPYFFIINVSGGGTRSATFSLSVLQRLDSISGGRLMDKTFLITGASGGMLGAAYYRELARERAEGKNLYLYSNKYVDDISKDLLNPTFSSFVARDMAAPAQKFKIGNYYYIKDRGYAFEEKLRENTRNLLNRQLKDIAKDEQSAKTPLMFFNAVIVRDGRKMVISTQPVSFLMMPHADSTRHFVPDPDEIDFAALFAKQDPMNMRLLTALRMNATFPYVLPNVWLPSKPVIDVMDAGLRDNYGAETALRFVEVFKDWLKENTAGVVMLQIRDRQAGGWDDPFESGDISELATKPMLLLQYNWYKMQEYNQDNTLALTRDFMNDRFYRISFQYAAKNADAKAALNFHLTQREKVNILEALDNENNTRGFASFANFLPSDSMRQR